MNAYLVYQTQQMERARTFAEIRRIEERVSSMAQAKPEVRRRAVWPFGALAARRRRAVVPCTPLSRREVPVEARGHPSRPRRTSSVWFSRLESAPPGAEFEQVQPVRGAWLLPGAVALSRHGVVLPVATLSLLLR